MEKDLCSKHDIKGYPTVRIFKRDSYAYSGTRSKDSLVEFVLEATGDNLKIDDVDLEKLENMKFDDFPKADDDVCMCVCVCVGCGVVE